MNYKISNILLLVACIFIVSCKIHQSDHVKSKTRKDIFGKVYHSIEYYKNDTIEYYIDTIGKKYKICSTPDKEAELFPDSLQYLKFVRDNLIQYDDIEGRVYIALYIDNKGKIIGKRVIKGMEICPECSLSALDLLSKIVLVKPAYKNRNPVNSIKIIAVPFK